MRTEQSARPAGRVTRSMQRRKASSLAGLFLALAILPSACGPRQPAFTPTPEPTPRPTRAHTSAFEPADCEFPAYAGSVGEAFTTEFMGFIKVFRELPDIAQIRTNPESAPIPSEPSATIAVTCSLASKAEVKNANWIFRYINRLPTEYQCKFVSDANVAHPEIASTREFIQWQSDNKDVLFN